MFAPVQKRHKVSIPEAKRLSLIPKIRFILSRQSSKKKKKSREQELETTKQHQCILCCTKKCIYEQQSTICSGRQTRSMTKFLGTKIDFIIIEAYRCMPLLGDEEKKVPDWKVHIVHYVIVLTNF